MSLVTHIARAGKYPVAQVTCPHFSEKVDLSGPRTGVLHTTEGGFAGSMSVFRRHFAPHFIVGLDNGKPVIEQLVPIGTIGAALVTHNNKAIVQIEVVGFSKETPWIFDDLTLDALASLLIVCRDTWGIPLTHPWPDGDFGKAGDNPHRHSGKFGSVAGWFSHGDVPAPDNHWDCGNLEWSKLWARCAELQKDAA